MIRLEGLRKNYPELDLELSLDVKRGELVSILGPSGSGKTTILRLIAGFERLDAGRIILDGEDVTNLHPARRQVGFVFQDYTLFPHLDVFGNVVYGLKGTGLDRSRTRHRAEELLAVVGLPGYEGRRVQTLSGGEQQRVAIARAVAREPVVLVLDEPFSSIDTALRKNLRREIVRLQTELGITTLFVTHSREEALSISDRVIVLLDGKLQQYGSPDELYLQPVNRFVASFVGEASFIPVRITGTTGNMVRLECFAEFIAASSREAGDAILMLRPHHLRFTAGRETNAFRIILISKQYFGHYYEYTGEAHGHIFTVFDRERRSVGENCWVGFHPKDAVLLPASPPEE